MKKLKEYIDNGDNYVEPERHFENDVLDIRLYCGSEGCNVYCKGKEGYNGGFVAENGEIHDLRNVQFLCKKHAKEIEDMFKDL